MAQAETEFPDLEIDGDLWVELEVPYGKIEEKWDQRYEAELKSNVEKGRVRENILNIYAELLDLGHFKEPNVVIDQIIAQDQRLGYNLVCLKMFSDYKNLDFFKSYRDFLYRHCEGTAIHSHYNKAWDDDDKVALTGLIQLFDPEGKRLKSIHALDYCDRKKPKTVSTDSALDDFDLQGKAEDIVAEIQSGELRSYQKWHDFEYDGREYILIKREIGDDVERQATGNIEEEPATFVALRHSNGDLEIITEKMSVANMARQGVNQSVEEVEFETVEPRATTDNVKNFISGLLDGDLHARLEESSAEVDPDRLIVTGLKLKSSPLPGHPSLQMKTEEGITRTLNALDDAGYDLLENIHDVEVIHTRFDGREYSIRPKEQEQSEGSLRWKFTYDARQPPREEREAFDKMLSAAFDIDLLFERA